MSGSVPASRRCPGLAAILVSPSRGSRHRPAGSRPFAPRLPRRESCPRPSGGWSPSSPSSRSRIRPTPFYSCGRRTRAWRCAASAPWSFFHAAGEVGARSPRGALADGWDGSRDRARVARLLRRVRGVRFVPAARSVGPVRSLRPLLRADRRIERAFVADLVPQGLRARAAHTEPSTPRSASRRFPRRDLRSALENGSARGRVPDGAAVALLAAAALWTATREIRTARPNTAESREESAPRRRRRSRRNADRWRAFRCPKRGKSRHDDRTKYERPREKERLRKEIDH